MSWSDLLPAVIGGLVGGSLSALLTWLWTHRKWERTARAFKTTARYLARLILAPESVGSLREDEKGWLRGFDQILHAKPEELKVSAEPLGGKVQRVEENDEDQETGE